MLTAYHILSLFFVFLLYRIFVATRPEHISPLNTIPYTASFAAGIAIQYFLEIQIMFLYIVLFLIFQKPKILTLCCMGALSFATFQSHYINHKKNIKRSTTRAIVTDIENYKKFQKIFLLTKTGIKILIFSQNKTTLNPGDQIKLKPFKIKTKFSLYELKEKIIATQFVNKFFFEKCISKKSLTEIFIKKRFLIYDSLKKKMPIKTFSYFSSIFLGKKEYASNTMAHHFNYWGISHQLSRSGLHIALFLLLIYILLSYIPIPYKLKHIFALTTCITYSILSWPSTPFLRAINLFILCQTGRIINRQINPLYAIQIITILTLITNPAQLFFLDFQLSFALTIALILSFNPSKKPVLLPQ